MNLEKRFNSQKLQQGFSLVELMVVITIIGILAGVAIPKFQTFRARATQTEAKSGLNGIFLSMQAYEANFGEYPLQAAATAMNTRIDAIGFAAGGNQQKYSYSYISNVNNGWAAIARSTAALVEGRFDYFRINTNKWLCQPYDSITNLPGIAPTGTAAAGTLTTQQSGRECPQTYATGVNSNAVALTNRDCSLGTEATCTL